MFKYLIAFVFITTHVFSQNKDTVQYQIKDRENAVYQQDKPYVILISADGFRYDLAKKYKAENLLRLAANGVAANAMIPSFPSITFPNHYSIITGLYPSHHGLIDNVFFDKNRNQNYNISDKNTVRDGSWYGGLPLWALAEREKMLSASLFWVSSESDAGGIRPSYYYHYQEQFSIDKKVAIVKSWLSLAAEKRPHFITFYFPEVDHQMHKYGVESKEAKEAVQFVDSGVGKLVDMVQGLGLKNVNFIFVSDHGMIDIDSKKLLALPKCIDKSKFRISNTLTFMQLYAQDEKDIMPLYHQLQKEAKDYKVYLKKDMPKYLHFDAAEDRWDRIGDLILLADAPLIFDNEQMKNIKKGKHGYDPYQVEEMKATFYAWGPQLKNGLRIPEFENIHVYPLIAQILGLHISNKIDGNIEILKNILN